MTIKITRQDIKSAELRKKAGLVSNAELVRRLLAIALVLDGFSRTRAASMSGMDRQTLCDWVHRYNDAGIEGLHDKPHGGAPARKLTQAQEIEIASWVRQGPDIVTDGVVRWRRVDLRDKIAREFGAKMHERTVGKLLRRLGFSHISVRPRHPKADPEAQEDHRRNFADLVHAACPEPVRNRPIELWWQDEARVGQQGTLTYIWAEKGTRPQVLRDQRRESAYIFGAVCPGLEKAAALVLPKADTEGMNLHLQEISRHVAQGAHAVIVLDGAKWHEASSHLKLPGNISLLTLPPYSPELNPEENVWQYLRQNDLSNRVFETYEQIVDACCIAWNKFIAIPARIKSIAQRSWAQCVNA